MRWFPTRAAFQDTSRPKMANWDFWRQKNPPTCGQSRWVTQEKNLRPPAGPKDRWKFSAILEAMWFTTKSWARAMVLPMKSANRTFFAFWTVEKTQAVSKDSATTGSLPPEHISKDKFKCTPDCSSSY